MPRRFAICECDCHQASFSGPCGAAFLDCIFWFFSTFGPCGQLFQHFQLFTFRFSGHAGGFSEIPNSQFSIFRALRAALPRIQIVQFSFSGPAGPLQKKAAAKRVVLTQNGELPRGEEGTGGLLYSKLKNRLKKSCTRENFSPFLAHFRLPKRAQFLPRTARPSIPLDLSRLFHTRVAVWKNS